MQVQNSLSRDGCEGNKGGFVRGREVSQTSFGYIWAEQWPSPTVCSESAWQFHWVIYPKNVLVPGGWVFFPQESKEDILSRDWCPLIWEQRVPEARSETCLGPPMKHSQTPTKNGYSRCRPSTPILWEIDLHSKYWAEFDLQLFSLKLSLVLRKIMVN